MKGLILLFLAVAVTALPKRNFEGVLNRDLLSRGATPAELTSKAGELWFTSQKVNHFDNADTSVWSQRYFVNETFYKSGNPVFFQIGGEGAISATYVGPRFITSTYAEQYGALIIALEHRFYGSSMPTADSSATNLRLLSSDQALADLVTFRQYVMETYKMPADTKWIVFGGSYPGCLSGWARAKFPTLFHGSLASSGPVEALEDFNMYLQVVSNSLGSQCAGLLAQATTQIETLLNSPSGRTQLQQTFNTCTPIQTDLDVSTFLESITDSVAGVVQYNHDNGHVGLDIDGLCQIFTNGQSDLVSAWAAAYVAADGTACVGANYTDYIKSLAATSASRSWTWQTCTEFGFYQTGEVSPSFSKNINLQFFRQICQDTFGPMRQSPDTDWINANYGSTNLKYVASNTVFSDGTVDPWHALAILPKGGLAGQELLQQNSAAVLIEGTAHCADLYAASPNDLPGLTYARQLTQNLLAVWLNGY